ncbi:uncharacterized protein ATNIH1004_003670 [Aspergillus tanneri]|uniref:Uncharacterized protein n=1 Tax=Aspergillus tanneri TaxID=1220188 RepID=A0A5M9N1Y6_9EURO|nr:uncharacterized protein ATNIH1004_003670 [Aspergillus tanneri]KAA8650979.1 hypothetical protein ATNIH1004_003670 [Aspergillus tanneri]
MAGVLFILLLLFMFFRTTLALSNCTHLFNTAVINNDTLFIDGGEMHTLLPNGTITTKAIYDLETVDLSKSWKNSDSDLFNYISKPYNASHPDKYPPTINNGASWSDGENLYFYGGYVSDWGGPPVPPLGTWRYIIAVNNWTNTGFWGVPLVRLSEGGSMRSSVDKKAYYLSGILHPAGNPSFAGTPGADVYIVSGLISLNMANLEWTNYSTSAINNYGTIGAGYVGLIESVGDKGVIAAFGGETGGATITEPEHGFNSSSLKDFIQQTLRKAYDEHGLSPLWFIKINPRLSERRFSRRLVIRR